MLMLICIMDFINRRLVHHEFFLCVYSFPSSALQGKHGLDNADTNPDPHLYITLPCVMWC